MDAIWFVVFIICLQQFEGNVIYPKVVGSTIGLPGVWVMTAVTVCSNLFGIMGIIIGTPLAAVIYTVIKRVTSNRLLQKNLTNDDLAPGRYPYIEASHLSLIHISFHEARPIAPFPSIAPAPRTRTAGSYFICMDEFIIPAGQRVVKSNFLKVP